ncbi:hypothetical protein [Streptomyces sp. UG1]|uniref:hypothetical protein n=1 Tax=Streptomyces sp. UG1 TaxID=3417652 RepID=UPI003CEDE854
MLGSDSSLAGAVVGEGIRGLAKSAARMWKTDGITSNVLAVGRKALEAAHNGGPWARFVKDVGPLLGLMARDAAFGAPTGQTVVVDGGEVMAP